MELVSLLVSSTSAIKIIILLDFSVRLCISQSKGGKPGSYLFFLFVDASKELTRVREVSILVLSSSFYFPKLAISEVSSTNLVMITSVLFSLIVNLEYIVPSLLSYDFNIFIISVNVGSFFTRQIR